MIDKNVTGLTEVTKEELWNFVGDKNVIYKAVGDSPFVGIWADRSGNVIAKEIPHGEHLGISSDEYKYYIKA